MQHIETGLCQGTVEYKQKLRQSIEEEKGGRQINVKKEKRDGSSRDDDDGVEEGMRGRLITCLEVMTIMIMMMKTTTLVPGLMKTEKNAHLEKKRNWKRKLL